MWSNLWFSTNMKSIGSLCSFFLPGLVFIVGSGKDKNFDVGSFLNYSWSRSFYSELIWNILLLVQETADDPAGSPVWWYPVRVHSLQSQGRPRHEIHQVKWKFESVLRIHDFGPGSADACLWLMDPDPDPAIFVIELQDANKKLI